MDTIAWIVIGIAAALLIALVIVVASWQRQANLKKRFGPEYDREVAIRGSEREATRHLSDVADRRDQLDIRQLEPTARDRYTQRWAVVQSEFVDRPGPALDEADRLITDVMRDRGYPVENFGERAELVAADHPQIVQHYRAAHAARQDHRGRPGTVGTEEMRQAFVHYRALFDELIRG
jgi:hypothetical protein